MIDRLARRPASLTRRNALQTTLAGAMAASAWTAEATAKSRPPNIIFILADDMGYADVGCYGREDIATPNIDFLARRGVQFTQAYANSAVCSSTRTALITGRYQYRLPIGLEEPLAGTSGHVGLPPDHPTLPSLLRKLGYHTMLIGKWHLGQLPTYSPLKSGYDHFYGFRGGALDYFTHAGVEGAADLWNDDNPVRDPGYLTELLGAQSDRAIDGYAASTQPFLLSLHFNAPHWPWEGPADIAESDRVRGTRLRDFDGGSQKTYAAMISSMDDQVGRVLAALRRHNLTDNTIVVFTSDNGGERYAKTWPFTGQKTELLEGGLRVPALVSWPAVLKAGSVSSQVMISMDWLPTLLAAAGGAPDPDYPSDGLDLLPVLRGGAEKGRVLYWRYKANRQRAMRSGDLKYLKILDNDFLFNVIDDPLERANLKERHRDVFERMKAQWLAWEMTMLPERDGTFTEGVTGAVQADHFGATKADGKADQDP